MSKTANPTPAVTRWAQNLRDIADQIESGELRVTNAVIENGTTSFAKASDAYVTTALNGHSLITMRLGIFRPSQAAALSRMMSDPFTEVIIYPD